MSWMIEIYDKFRAVLSLSIENTARHLRRNTPVCAQQALPPDPALSRKGNGNSKLQNRIGYCKFISQ